MGLSSLACGLLVVGLGLWAWLDSTPTAPAAVASTVTPEPAKPRPEPQSKAGEDPKPRPADPPGKPDRPADAPATVGTSASTSGEVSLNASINTPGTEPRPSPSPAAEKPKFEAKPKPPEVDLTGPVTPNVPRAKLADYAGHLVTLEKSYCLGRSAARLANGTLRIALIEGHILLGSKAPYLKLDDKEIITLDLHPRLAEQLVSLSRLSPNHDANLSPSSGWDGNPAIVTVKAAPEIETGAASAGLIVGLEFFQRFETHVVHRRNSFRPTLSVTFHTTTVTTTSNSQALGNKEEWSRPGRLGIAEKAYHKKFETIYQSQNRAIWSQFDNLMNRSIDAGIRGAIQSNQATQEYIRQQIDPAPLNPDRGWPRDLRCSNQGHTRETGRKQDVLNPNVNRLSLGRPEGVSHGPVLQRF